MLQARGAQAPGMEAMAVLELKRTIATLKPEIRGMVKEALYRISRSAGSRSGSGSRALQSGRQDSLDSFVVHLLYNS